MTFSYACADYPGMETCVGRFEAGSESELWQHIESHAVVAHGEDPSEWSEDDRSQVAALVRRTD
ncbi:MAG: DUF1059 domain-containing protein [Actinobacteria bacterium]|nr:DUF1059 domain-containing protein [Actinomycetota bacterium]NIS32187.1 DUF1059 domain-containing protein [Actinomycetota bacterium]NIT96132.1 DUF1059 domain-containing protein [Actinomycetota bacterium]NIU19814.1 DUF1059 domain-containing protein [Actinomycetota bacterium]NIU67248.1 DUF1059 domain-containing protein [Actinomycetota bacterium]